MVIPRPGATENAGHRSKAALRSAHYATAESPTGPWQYRGVFLASNDRHKGPGHHSIIRHPVTGEWLLFYHRWNDQAGDGPYRGSRQIAIDRVEHDAEGLIRPVVMTDGLGVSSPVPRGQ